MMLARTAMCPSPSVPRAPPSKRTSRSRASLPPTDGQGCPGLQVSSISRAATPAMRTFGPSAHQIGPSPSQTAIGVHLNVWPAGTTSAGVSDTGRKLAATRAIVNLIMN